MDGITGREDQERDEGTRCVFCAIVACDEPANVLREWPGVLAIEPLRPVVAGHTIVIPTQHVDDALEDPDVTAAVVRAAAEMAESPCNIITSVGSEATQSVLHLHVHIVPRSEGDGLALPWTDQREAPYRAGREDAARDLRTAVRLIGTECENFRSGTCVDSGRTPDARYTADRWCDHCILREALAGDGVQPTEEQRAVEEDQERDEEES